MLQPQQRTDTPLDFLAQLQDTDKAHLYKIGKRRLFSKNDYIFKAGENEQNAYVLIRGRVKLFGSSTEGRDVLLWFSIAGEVFGLAECLHAKPRQVYARAEEPSEVLCIEQTIFDEWLISRPEIAVCLMRIMAARMRDLGQRFLSLANGNIQMEIAQLLIRLGATYGKLIGRQIHMAIPLTEQDIADMVGSSRQGVSTCLAKMKREGTIDVVKRFLTIKDQDDLRQIANGPDGILVVERRARERRLSELDWRSTVTDEGVDSADREFSGSAQDRARGRTVNSSE